MTFKHGLLIAAEHLFIFDVERMHFKFVQVLVDQVEGTETQLVGTQVGVCIL